MGGDVSFAVPVTVYDDGAHVNPKPHKSNEFQGTLLYTCGALLNPDKSSADWNELVLPGPEKKLNEAAYSALYERRLLPNLKYASNEAMKKGKKAIVTIPGLGCGCFAGRFQKTLGEILGKTLKKIVETHAASLKGIQAVWYDPYNESKESSAV